MGSQLARLSTHWGALMGQVARTRLRMRALAVAKTRLGIMAVAAETRLVVVQARVRELQPDLGGQQANHQDQGE